MMPPVAMPIVVVMVAVSDFNNHLGMRRRDK
jgi:hypothetical protein